MKAISKAISKEWGGVFLILILGLVLRFLWFASSTYFGFDEARDAFTGLGIYKNFDLKIVGPPANAPGLNHGVLHWYIVGLVYLLGGGNPFFVSGVYRVLNGLGILLIYWLGREWFGKKTGYIAAFIYAVSFEQIEYALYMGNPSLGILAWMAVFVGATIIWKKKNKFWGLPLMALGAGVGAQLELTLVTMFGVVVLAALLLLQEVKKVEWKSWLVAGGIGLGLMSTFILGELKSGFRMVRSGLALLGGGYSVIGNTETKWSVYWKRFLLMFHDNVFPIENKLILSALAIGLTVILLVKSRKSMAARLTLLWMYGGALVLSFGAYNAYYINVGLGVGIILGLAAVLSDWGKKSLALVAICLLVIAYGNWQQISVHNPRGLIEDLKTQQYMSLSDELAVVDYLYQSSEDKAFTVRVTSMPFKIQTVWAYLISWYAVPKYNYMPFWEHGNVLGFPGEMKPPKNGTTCIRYWVREPRGGIPQVLIELETKEENSFSTVVSEKEIGNFVIQKRWSVDEVCKTVRE